MVLWGSLINALAIMAGAVFGRAVKMPERFRQTIINGLGLAIAIIGISMGLESNNILIPIIALVAGAICGEVLKIEARLAKIGDLLKRQFQRQTGQNSETDFTEGFLTATLVFCIGAMAVIGGLNSGLKGEHQVLYAKSMLDGVLTIFFSASFGIGAGFSAIPVFLYQGTIALLATFLAPILSEPVIQEITSTGGILILGIGLNTLGLTKIAVGNLLPAIALAAAIAAFFS